MVKRHSRRASLALIGVAALVAVGCTPVDDSNKINGVTVDYGVTAEPCPEAINKDNGCIYLGVLSDLTEGPFAALAVPITDGQRAFFKRVNDEGGIGGFDIDIDTNTRDTKYQAQEHAAQYRQISGNILAIAQSLGTVNTESVLDDMDTNNIIAVPASWWSGYAFPENDKGLILESGYSYCVEAMGALDWYTEKRKEPASVQAVGYPGDFGGDSQAGVKLWADHNGVKLNDYIPTGPNQQVGDQSAVIQKILQDKPEVVMLAVGPAETAQIVGGLAAQGFRGQFLGSIPTWNPALLGTAAAPALEAMYLNIQPWQNWDADSVAVKAAKASTNGKLPANQGYLVGWYLSYPMLAALESAIDKGDLTRAGLRASLDGLVVDYEGGMPNQTFSGKPVDFSAHAIYVNAPDAQTELGLKSLDGPFVGKSFKEIGYDKACSASS
ncbi:MAG: ABC transporter substrate-binding protein [Microbacteriaceae bacterium]